MYKKGILKKVYLKNALHIHETIKFREKENIKDNVYEIKILLKYYSSKALFCKQAMYLVDSPQANFTLSATSILKLKF